MSEKVHEILTIDEVAVFLKAGKRTVYRLASACKIPAFKLGAASIRGKNKSGQRR